MQTQKITLENIRIDGGTQSRAEINAQTVADYTEAIKGGTEFPPIIVFFDGTDYWLADGFHRYHAHTGAGHASIVAEVINGTARDAVLYSFGVNGSHGLQRTNADKRKAVLGMLSDSEWGTWSDNSIAKQCAVGHPFVGRVRLSLVSGTSDKSQARTYTTKSGKVATMKTGAIGEAKPDAEPAHIAPAATQTVAGTDMTREQLEEDAHEGVDLVSLLEETQKELEAALAVIKAAEADDLKAEAMKWRISCEIAYRRRDELMDTAAKKDRELRRMMTVLRRIGRAVGEEDTFKVAAAVKSMAARSRVEALVD